MRSYLVAFVQFLSPFHVRIRSFGFHSIRPAMIDSFSVASDCDMCNISVFCLRLPRVFSTPPSDQLRGRMYTKFLEDLREYLGGFLTRTQPLVSLSEVSR